MFFLKHLGHDQTGRKGLSLLNFDNGFNGLCPDGAALPLDGFHVFCLSVFSVEPQANKQHPAAIERAGQSKVLTLYLSCLQTAFLNYIPIMLFLSITH